ncbi:MAG TPA: hypothetical protein PKE12_07745 [Kiritimatiellia bacterium]|nr:hypothetical protein [Kiritimatiellia bacterium]
MKRILRTGLLGAACWIAGHAYGLQVPLHFSITNTVLNEFGQVLPGSSVQAPAFNQPYVEGALVQVLNVSGGTLPPDTNGVPHPSNAILLQTRIGEGIDPKQATSGRSSGSITALNRSSSSTGIFIKVRVFNKPTLEESSFYGESQAFNVPTYDTAPYDVFLASVSATTNELDTTDHDGDGLSRSWEKSYGTDPAKADTDDDGMIDGHEIRAGTDATDPDSLLIVVHLTPGNGNDLQLSWDTVPGKAYQLQMMEAMTNGAFFADIEAPVTATGMVTSIVVPDGLLNPQSLYRVRLDD